MPTIIREKKRNWTMERGRKQDIMNGPYHQPMGIRLTECNFQFLKQTRCGESFSGIINDIITEYRKKGDTQNIKVEELNSRELAIYQKAMKDSWDSLFGNDIPTKRTPWWKRLFNKRGA